MKIYSLHTTQLIKKNCSDVFSFFENPSNLSKITPPQLGFKLLTPLPVSMEKGCLIDYTIRMMGFPIRWTSYICEYDPPKKFVDVQLKGPYSFWHHAHFFKEHPEGTLIKDVVHYGLPLGVVGQFMTSSFVKARLQSIFDYRRASISRMFDQ